jgi:hypothetical protein
VSPIKVEAPVATPTPEPVEPIDPSTLLQQAGLVLIETTSASAAPIQQSAPIVGRKPKPAAIIVNEPLQMVETRNEGH